MTNSQIITWNLEEIVNELVKHHSEIDEIYLFGSRAYNTNSLRSDIDLLAISKTIIPAARINSWLHDMFPPVDLFTSYDGLVATSVVNGSAISYRSDSPKGYSSLADQLDAICLWDCKNGLSASFSAWHQQALNNINFAMSIIPSSVIPDFDDTMNKCLQNLETAGIKTFFAGSSWSEIASSIVSIIEAAFVKPTKYQKKADYFSFDKLKIASEYDFQNMIHFLLRPLFRDIESENIVISLEGAKKIADFGVGSNQIIIEAKWVNSNNKKAEVLKTLDGLSNFYSENANVKCIIFLILHDKSVSIDPVELEYRYSYEKKTPQIFVRFIQNTF